MPWCGEDPRKTVTPGFAAGETFCEPSWRCCCLLEMLFLGGTKLLFHKGGFKSLTCCADRQPCPLSLGPCHPGLFPTPVPQLPSHLLKPVVVWVFLSAPFISVALIKQFVTDVAWGDLDFLIVDTPPGTSDEHISTVEALRPYQLLGAILVTTPQVGHGTGIPGRQQVWRGEKCTPGLHRAVCGCLLYTSALEPQSVWAEGSPVPVVPPQAVSVGDVRRELTFCRKAGLRILGIVENMSGFVCPHCSVSSPDLIVQPWGSCGLFLVLVGC